jgi:hypothetical protein
MPLYGDPPFEYGEAPYGYGPYGGDLLIIPYELPEFPTALPTFTNPQDAFDASYTSTSGLVYVGETTIDCESWSVQLGVDQAIGTCRFTVPLPRPESIVGGAEVTIVGGHNDLVGVLFSGRIISWSSEMSMRGDTMDVTAVGWLSLLNDADLYELSFTGPISLS